MQQDDRFSKIIFAGHSEGALVVTLAAQQREDPPTKLKGVILLAGVGTPAGEVLKKQLLGVTLTAELRAESLEALDRLEQGKRVENVSKELNAIFRQSVQNYLISWFAIDPAKELARLTLPVLIVSGGQDLQVEVAEATKLAHSAQHGQLLHIEVMNHILKPTHGDRAKNVATYSQPDLPLVPELLPAIAAFIAAQH